MKLGYAFTEPLIYLHLKDSVEYAKQKKLFVSITTNALGLKKWAGVLDDAGVDEINISLDGPSEIHNYVRGNKHSYAKAIDGIEELQKRRSKIDINIYCVITEWNAGKLEDFLECLSAYKLYRVGLMHSNFTPQHIADEHNKLFGDVYPATASNVTDVKNESINISKLWNEIQAIKSKKWKFKVEFSPDIDSAQKLEQYYINPDVLIGKRCLDIFSNMMIKSNGDVIPAHGRCYNLRIGNLYEDNLKNIWNSIIVAKFRKTVMKQGGLLPGCSRCCSGFVK